MRTFNRKQTEFSRNYLYKLREFASSSTVYCCFPFTKLLAAGICNNQNTAAPAFQHVRSQAQCRNVLGRQVSCQRHENALLHILTYVYRSMCTYLKYTYIKQPYVYACTYFRDKQSVCGLLIEEIIIYTYTKWVHLVTCECVCS